MTNLDYIRTLSENIVLFAGVVGQVEETGSLAAVTQIRFRAAFDGPSQVCRLHRWIPTRKLVVESAIGD